MPYIGRGPSKSGAFRILDDISGSFNGSTTSFALTVGSAALTVGLPETLLIAVDGVIQEAGSAYTISGSNIVFGSAPQDSATFWGVELGDVGGLADSAVKQAANDDTTKVATTSWVQDELDGYAADTATFTNKTFDVEATGNSVSNIDVANLKSGVLDTDISSVSGSDDTLASAKSIKTYVDAQVTAQDLDATTDSGTIDIDLDSETLTIAGGEGIDTSATGTTITIAGEDATTSNKGVASFHSDNFAVSSGAVTIKDNGVRAAELYTTSGTAGSGTFLRGDETWAAAGGGLVFIDTAVASTSSTLEVTLTGSYETYLITGSDLKPGNDVVDMRGNFGASGSWTISGYKNAFHRVRSDAVHDMATSLTTAVQLSSTIGNATGEGVGFAIWFTRPIGTADVYPNVYGDMLAVNHSTIIEAGHIFSFVSSDIDIARFKIAFSAGTITSGRLTVWGLVHA